MKQIKFSRCPIAPHKGEEWEKLRDIESGSTAILEQVGVFRISELPIGFWREDTFSDIDRCFIDDLFAHFYGIPKIIMGNVPVIVLTFRQGEKTITTARGYDNRKYVYYRGALGEVFHVEKEAVK